MTFDTTKKVLVVHDGVSAGGKAIDGFVKLDPGGPTVVQEIQSAVVISGGEAGEIAGLDVTNGVTTDYLSASQSCDVKKLTVQQEALTYAGTMNLDLNGYGGKRIALTGNVSFTSTAFGYGRQLLVRIVGDTSLRTVSWPGAWRWVGTAAPASLAANKIALLQLWCFGTSESDVVARWLVEP